VLWKGIGSALIVKGLTLAVEDVLSKITPWPKSVFVFKYSYKYIFDVKYSLRAVFPMSLSLFSVSAWL